MRPHIHELVCPVVHSLTEAVVHREDYQSCSWCYGQDFSRGLIEKQLFILKWSAVREWICCLRADCTSSSSSMLKQVSYSSFNSLGSTNFFTSLLLCLVWSRFDTPFKTLWWYFVRLGVRTAWQWFSIIVESWYSVHRLLSRKICAVVSFFHWASFLLLRNRSRPC